MDFMEKITELRAKKGQLLTQAQALVDEGKIEEANEFTSQMEAINTSIAGLEALAKASQEGAEPVYDGALHGGKPKDEGKGEDKPFTSLGEQLQAVYNFRKNHVEDKRLQRVNNAVLGVNEGSGADGGFVIQTDFAGMILESAVQQSPLLNRLDRYTCSSAAQRLYVPLPAAENRHVQRLLARLRGGLEPAGRRRPGGPAYPFAHRLLLHPKGSGDGPVLVRLQRGRAAPDLFQL